MLKATAVLGCEVIISEDGAGWTAFLRDLVTRGLSGVRLVVSDDHKGLKQSVAAVLPGGRLAPLPPPLRPQPARPGTQVAQGHGRRSV